MRWTPTHSWLSDCTFYLITQVDEKRIEVFQRDVLAGTWKFEAACGSLESARTFAESIEEARLECPPPAEPSENR